MKWNGLGHEDITEAFEYLGHNVYEHSFNDKELHNDDEIERSIHETVIENNADLVFSFNYFPIIAKACHDNDIPYFSWVYDSPAVLLYHFSLAYPTNHIFLFDHKEYAFFKSNGIDTVHYLPLAANPRRLNKLFANTSCKDAFNNSKALNQTDIAFVGSLYTEKHLFYERMTDICPYTRGYLEGIMAAQKKIYGDNFISDLLTDKIMDDMSINLPMKPDPEGVETRSYLFGEYVVNRKLTQIERLEFLNAIGKKYKFDLYTPDSSVVIPGATNHGPVDYLEMAPFVFKKAKINLNISLRSIHTGVPLRCFEIIASHGLLLSNYQSGFEDVFKDGFEYVPFENKDDLISKIKYLLEHDDERMAIAQNGYNRLVKEHTYDARINEMFSYL